MITDESCTPDIGSEKFLVEDIDSKNIVNIILLCLYFQCYVTREFSCTKLIQNSDLKKIISKR